VRTRYPIVLFAAACTLLCAADSPVVLQDSFEVGHAAIEQAGWRLSANATVESGDAHDGDHLLRCACGEPGSASYATRPSIAVKPDCGYIARCRYRAEGAAHLTFGIMNPDGSFFVCKDTYVGGRDHWAEMVLPFRTEDQQTIQIYCGRRYGTGSVLFDSVELVEDDAVRTGDVSPTPNPIPEPTPDETRRGFITSSRHWMIQAYPTLHPKRTEVTDVLRATLAPGEYEPVTVSLTALRSLRNAHVSLNSDLLGPGGAVIPASEVQLGRIKTMQRWLTNAAPLKPGQRYERRPMFIFPMAPVDVPAGETQRFWLTIHAPEDSPPGLYTGQVAVALGQSRRATLDLRVRVLPIELPEPEVTYGMYFRHTHQHPQFQTEEFFRRSMADMRAHGCNSMSVYADVERKLPDGTGEIALDLAGRRYSLPHQMQMMSDAGLASEDHPMLFLAHGRTDGTFYNEERLVAAADELRRARDWPELLFYLVDEPHSEAQIEAAKQLNDVVHRVDGVRTTTAIADPGELARYYDVWIVSETIEYIDDLVQRARELGKEVWTYNCQWCGTEPRNDRFFTGLHTWTAGLRGNWQWCYTEESSGELRENGEIEYALPTYGDPWRYSYVVPGPDANYPTIGWEARREGADDYRYLQALREAIEVAEESGRNVARARAFLDDVQTRGHRPDQPMPASQVDRVYRHIAHPGLQPADYDQIRTQAADWIIKLTR